MSAARCTFDSKNNCFWLRGTWRIYELKGVVKSPEFPTVEGFPAVQLSIDFSEAMLSVCTTVIPYRGMTMYGSWMLVHKNKAVEPVKNHELRFWEQSPSSKVSLKVKTAIVKSDRGFIENGCLSLQFRYAFRRENAPAPVENPRCEFGRVGITNEQNTCYLNAVIQMLFTVPEFVRIIYQQKCENAASPIAALQRLFAWLQLSSRPAKTTSLTEAFGWRAKEVAIAQDANEFYLLFLDRILEVVRDQRLSTMFEFEEKCIRTCAEVGYEHVTGCKNTIIVMYACEGRSVQETINIRATESVMDAPCQVGEYGMRTCKVRYEFECLPDILVVSLERLLYSGNTAGQTILCENAIDYEEELEVSQVVSGQVEKNKYQLFGIIAHSGTQVNGHYITIVRDYRNPNSWILCNDHCLTRLTKQRAFEQTMKGSSWPWYMLFYVRNSRAKTIMRPLVPEDIPADVVERYRSDESARNNQEFEEHKIGFKILLGGQVGDCPPTDLFLATSYDLDLIRTEKLIKLQEQCAQMARTTVDKILLWKCTSNGQAYVHPETYINSNWDTTIDCFDASQQLFVQQFDQPLDSSRLESIILVFVRFYTQNEQRPVKYLGYKAMFQSKQTVSNLASEFPFLAEKRLICFKEYIDNAGRKQIAKVELSSTLADISNNRQTLFLVFQESPQKLLSLYHDDGIQDSSLLFPWERLNTYENFMREKYSKVVFRVVPKADPNHAAVKLRALNCGRDALTDLKKLIARIMTEEYTPSKDAMILEYYDPGSHSILPFKLSERTPSDTLLYYSIEHGVPESHLGQLPQVRVRCFADLCRLIHQSTMTIDTRMTVEQLVQKLKDKNIIPTSACCRVYEVITTRLVPCQMSDVVRPNSTLKIDIIPETTDLENDKDVHFCQVNQVRRDAEGFERGCETVPFFFGLHRAESLPDLVRRLEPVLQLRVTSDSKEWLTFESRSNSACRKLTDDSIPFQEIDDNCHLCVVLNQERPKPPERRQDPAALALRRGSTQPLVLAHFSP